ncbi:unnamed protein product, partial [Chrysoparadoxa australica]
RDHVAAGSCAGVASTLVCHPMDTIRTRLQAQLAVRPDNGRPQRFMGVVSCFRATVSEEGARALYKGMSFPLGAQAVYKSVIFGVNGRVKRWLGEGGIGRSTPSAVSLHVNCHPHSLLCAAILGSRLPNAYIGHFGCAVNSLVVAPVEMIRNQLMVQYSHRGSSWTYNGPFDCLVKLTNERGVRALWQGTTATMMRDSPGMGMYFASFEGAKALLAPIAADRPIDRNLAKPSLPTLLLAGSAAGVAFWVVALPFDSVKTLVQLQKPGRGPGAVDVALQLVKEGGLGRLYRGWPVAIGRGIPGAAVTLTVYDYAINLITKC